MSSGPVVSNTTPLINLTGIHLLDLLPQLYGAILLPRDVVTEFQTKSEPSDPVLDQLSWVTIEEAVVLDPALPRIGAGESAAISLALSSHARLILLDERKARQIAASRGLHVAGTLSVLLRAKDQQLIPLVKPYLDAMQAQGRYFGKAFIAEILLVAGE